MECMVWPWYQGFLFSRQKRAYSKCVLAGMWTEAPVIYILWSSAMTQTIATAQCHVLSKTLENFIRIMWPKFGNTIIIIFILLYLGLKYIYIYIFLGPPPPVFSSNYNLSKAVMTLSSGSTSPMSHSWSWQWFTLPTLPPCPRIINLSAMASRGQS